MYNLVAHAEREVNAATNLIMHLYDPSTVKTPSNVLEATSWLIRENARTCLETAKEWQKEWNRHVDHLTRATINTFFRSDIEDGEENLPELFERKADAMQYAIDTLPKEVAAIRDRYGFQDDGTNRVVYETSCYEVIHTSPNIEGRVEDKGMRPALASHPDVLGHHPYCFMQDQDMSFVHTVANNGVPSLFIRLKDIRTTKAVRDMDLKTHINEMGEITEWVASTYGQTPVLYNVCQAGTKNLYAFLDGIDSHMSFFIASPVDGTKTKLGEYVNSVPELLNTPKIARKRIQGDIVICEHSLAGVIETYGGALGGPAADFIRNFRKIDEPGKVKFFTPAVSLAVQNYLKVGRVPQPVRMVEEMATPTFTIPITDGTLPVEVDGKYFRLQDLDKKRRRAFFVAYEKDTLIQPEAMEVVSDYSKRSTVITTPGGHLDIFTKDSKQGGKLEDLLKIHRRTNRRPSRRK